MKLTLRKLLILLLLIPLSIGVGFGYDAAATVVEKRQYPIPERYASLINDQAEAFGIPAAILYALAHSESDFVSDAVSENGAVGLMQITPQRMEKVYEEILHEEIPDAGILYDPKTNLRVGAAWLSHLYQKYGVWNTVYAAWHAGIDAVDSWLADDDLVNDRGQLEKIPDKSTAKFVAKVKKGAEMYTTLYFNVKSSES